MYNQPCAFQFSAGSLTAILTYGIVYGSLPTAIGGFCQRHPPTHSELVAPLEVMQTPPRPFLPPSPRPPPQSILGAHSHALVAMASHSGARLALRRRTDFRLARVRVSRSPTRGALFFSRPPGLRGRGATLTSTRLLSGASPSLLRPVILSQ